ncbi:MAG: hypothetical protein NVSMB9_18310 [Isosphaeraceae bacterium]
MVALGRFRRVAREWLAAVLGLVILATAAAFYFHESGRRVHRLTLSAGSREGLRYQIAERLAASAARKGVLLRLVTTTGSEQSLDRVEAGTIDLALVQGGLSAGRWTHVRQVSSLKIEPLHLLVKAEIEPGAGEERGLEFLRGRSVNLSEVGSGTNDLAREVLSFSGLQGKGREGGLPADYQETTLGYLDLITATDRSKLPDAVFTVSALPSPVARHLITRHAYRLVPLRFGEAFALDSFASVSRLPETRAHHDVDRVHVSQVEIPAYTYSVSPPVPPRPVPTFGTRLLLVAGAGIEAEAVARLLEGGSMSGPGGPPLDPALIDLPPEFDWHDGTHTFRDRSKPLVFGDAIDFLEKGTSLFGGVLGGLFFLWQWYSQRTRRRGELGFESYMMKVSQIERRALQLEVGVLLDLKELVGLQVELSRVKTEALQRFADGELEGEALISGFVTHANDARDYLTRLILHERDNLEEKAARQERSAESVWYETLNAPPHPSLATGKAQEHAATGDAPGP